MSVTSRAPARPLILALIAAMAIAILPAGSALGYTDDPATVWINEIHYDNVGTDTGEFVEIAGPAGSSLTGWTIVLYNGSGGATYLPLSTLSGTLPNEQGGFGTAAVSTVGLQNGAPDGLALVNGTTVVQFLSYEGSFTATNGPATGLVSTDIGVDQEPAPAIGLSLALVGSGSTYQDFTWIGRRRRQCRAPRIEVRPSRPIPATKRLLSTRPIRPTRTSTSRRTLTSRSPSPRP